MSMPTADASTPAPTYGKPGEIEQALHRPVFTERAVENGKHDVDVTLVTVRSAGAMPLARATQPRIGRQHDAVAGFQHIRQNLLRAAADQPAAVFGDADRHRFIFFRIERSNHRRGRGERNFMFARAPAEQYADS